MREIHETPHDRARRWLALAAPVVAVTALVTALVVAGVVVAGAPSARASTITTTTSAPSSRWVLATVPSGRGPWNTVTYGGGLFVALGHTAEVATSRSGTHWTLHAVPEGAWSSVAYGNGRFIALSHSATGAREMVSTNGVEWVARSGPVGAWTSVAFGAGRFVAVGSDGQITTTTDGVNWRTTWVHSKFAFTSIAYGNGRFIAVDQRQGDDLISLDGLGWSFYPLTAGGGRWSAVTFGDGNFVAVEDAPPYLVASSVLGYTWSPHARARSAPIDVAAYGCATFVALGHATTGRPIYLTSPTGATWASAPLLVDPLAHWTAITFGSSGFVAVDAAGRIASLRASANCARVTPTPPKDVSGNVPSAGGVWTYMHPPISAGGATIDGYLVTITDGVTTRTCRAVVDYQPHCLITGLHDHRVYEVTTQAHNRLGYSVASDPQWVIPVPSWNFVAVAPTPVVTVGTRALVEVTGVRANAQGIYPESQMTIHVGAQLLHCQPSWFGECLVRVKTTRPGRHAIYATYTGYGNYFRTPTSYLTVVP
ncbi:MAG: fibronectin type III domain-containing protein [Acidobacteria bacterium]|nr:fibronectin type III domain-containing protein [Acidobacteriota bacterium]